MKEKSSSNKLEIIPKLERYVQYMLEIIFKLPRIEKFSIGNDRYSNICILCKSRGWS